MQHDHGRTAEMVAVMQAYLDGKKIESKPIHGTRWSENPIPAWWWDRHDYRIAVTKPFIDWSHVSKRFKWMATDKDGNTYLYVEKPVVNNEAFFMEGNHMHADFVRANLYASFVPGDCDWKDSLVGRSEGV